MKVLNINSWNRQAFKNIYIAISGNQIQIKNNKFVNNQLEYRNKQNNEDYLIILIAIVTVLKPKIKLDYVYGIL